MMKLVAESGVRGSIGAPVRETFSQVLSGGGVSKEDLPCILEETLNLFTEMHSRGAARSTRQAAFLYNTMIHTATSVGRFDLALVIFQRITEHVERRK